MTSPSSQKLRVAIICGGISSEREVSLKSGMQVMRHLDPLVYETRLVEVASLPRDIIQASTDHPFDVAFIALHGAFGEDGRVQALLDLMHIPYTGSGVFASALCMNKMQSRNLVSGIGVAVPKGFAIHHRSAPTVNDLAERITKKIGYPCMIKPNESGSSVGVSLVTSAAMLTDALAAAFAEDRIILVEEYIKGREMTCGVLGNASVSGELIALPPVEILPDGAFFDYHAKYASEKTRELCPAPLDPAQTEEVKRLATLIHERIGCDGVSRSDFILRDDTFYYLETNTIPGLTEQSLCPKEAAAAGFTFSEFLGKQVELAVEKAGLESRPKTG